MNIKKHTALRNVNTKQINTHFFFGSEKELYNRYGVVTRSE